MNIHRSPEHPSTFSSTVVKKLSPVLVPMLVHLITVIFSTGIYPDTFKLAVVTPVFKGGSRTQEDNYRPISVLPVMNRIVERVIHKRLFDYFDNHLKLIYKHQFGFRPKSGTENAAIELTDYILRSMDDGKIVTGVFCDLRKAFDLVDHQLLLEVLEKYGIRGQAHNIIASFLSNRKQVVKIGESLSSESGITTGVIQGSGLGPLLFTIFINAIGSLTLDGMLYLFADDALLVNTHDSIDSICNNVKPDVLKLLEFFNQRKLVLNNNKTNFMIFKNPRNKAPLPDELNISDDLKIQRVSTAKHLGVILNESMNFQDHIKLVERKLAPANGVLWKLRNVLPLRQKKLVYDTLLQTHLSYMVGVWGLSSWSSLSNIQVLQNRALRNVYNLKSRENRVRMYSHLVDQSLANPRNLSVEHRYICLQLDSRVYVHKHPLPDQN
jgi:Reverse transcriptase (RNA-dependent DNA polymerase)